jgi:hypothetical protein
MIALIQQAERSECDYTTGSFLSRKIRVRIVRLINVTPRRKGE